MAFSNFTDQEKETIISCALETDEGRIALAQAVTEPFIEVEVEEEEVDRFELMDFDE